MQSIRTYRFLLGDLKYLVMFTYLYLFASLEFFTPAFELLVIKQLWLNIK